MPSPARRSTWRSRSVSGSASSLQASAASCGSMTRSPLMHAPHRVGQLFGRHVFQQIPRSSGIEGAAQVSGAREGRENDDPHWSAAALQLGGNFQAGQLGHLDVGDEDVRSILLHQLQGLVAGARAGDDLDVVLHFQQCGQRPQHHGLVFGDDYPDLVALGACHPSVSQSGGDWRERQMNDEAGSGLGSVAAAIRRWPPGVRAYRASRCLRERRAPRPLSAISSVQICRRRCSRTCTAAPAHDARHWSPPRAAPAPAPTPAPRLSGTSVASHSTVIPAVSSVCRARTQFCAQVLRRGSR